jgi:hypothetical protein
MSLSSSPSPLPKLPFLIADAAFLAAAWFIAESSRHPLNSAAVAGIAGCAAGAALCGVVPFIVEYSRRQDAALDDRQRSLEALAATVATAAEQIGIAAAGLHEIAALAQRNLREAEKLPHRLSEQIAELEAKFNASRDDDREQLESELATLRASESERLEATAQKISRAAADWAKAESFGLRHVVAAKTFIAELEQKTAALRKVLDGARLPGAMDEAKSRQEPILSEPTANSGNRAAEPEFAAEVAEVGAAGEPETGAQPAPHPEPDPGAKPKRVAKKAYDPQQAIPGFEIADDTQPSVATVPVASADGVTRLLVTSYIGIGNRLFIRGQGPGLSWDEGIPLQFVSIGKWRWETAHATEAVKFKLLKNDRDECSSLPTDLLEPGQQQELTAAF